MNRGNFTILPNNIRLIKSRRMRCTGHIVHMEETRDAYEISVRKPEGKRLLRR
jgi:hypothetical protein